MKLNFKGKTAVITGASGGMGLEISKKLSQNNISVLMLDLQSPSKEFLNKNKNCEFKKVDVTNFKKLKIYIDTFYNSCSLIRPRRVAAIPSKFSGLRMIAVSAMFLFRSF